MGVALANLSGTDPTLFLDVGLHVGGSREKRVPLMLFDAGRRRPPLLDVGLPRCRVRLHLLRSLGLQRV